MYVMYNMYNIYIQYLLSIAVQYVRMNCCYKFIMLRN